MQDLFVPGSLASGGSFKAAPASALARRPGHGQFTSNSKQAGPLMQLQLQHLGDGASLGVSVQVSGSQHL